MTITASSFLGLERPGLRVTGVLPDNAWTERWEGIVVPPSVKSRLLNFGLFAFVGRGSASFVGLPVHGLVLLAGPPGTGKTTLAHGLANELASELVGRGLAEAVLFALVDPHAFPSEFLGESQRAVGRLFGETLPELAAHGLPVVVLLDEVETLAVTRARASFDTNPVDVHRATDAVLTGLDSVTARYRNLLFVATTNDERAVDDAFLSRVDLREYLGMPDLTAAQRILAQTLTEVGVTIDGGLATIAELCVSKGLDARQIRKLVLRAIVAADTNVALDPSRLLLEHLEGALATLA